ncbi:MAG: 30S ribosomal protein S8 [Synergistetes bacterium]|nr:30S ribosomal protein S8 [Synergistota bacterium]MCX8128084.1 30S ribosomal protein S8 [Synergistota bacterium]MDW8192460.1 30S ribosomal protein S8 [Synergistota bacterium]
MFVTDPIGDMLTRIRNANIVYHESVDIPLSKIKLEIAKILKREGFIKGFKLVKEDKIPMIRIFLKYGPNKEKVIAGLKRVSKPGRRVYVGKDNLPKVMGGLGIAILSTSNGIMTDKEAREKGIGGEVLCYVW